jgi:uncharacterized membrane protein YcaP (DUF421 family)
MRRERLTLDDLAQKARISEIESLDEVQWAVLETNATSASHPEEVAAHLDLAVALKSQLSFLPVYLDRQESAQVKAKSRRREVTCSTKVQQPY